MVIKFADFVKFDSTNFTLMYMELIWVHNFCHLTNVSSVLVFKMKINAKTAKCISRERFGIP